MFVCRPSGVPPPQFLSGVRILAGGVASVVGAEDAVNGVKKVVPDLVLFCGYPLQYNEIVFDIYVDVEDEVQSRGRS